MLLTGQDNPALWSGPVMAPPPAQPATPFEWLTYSNQGATRSQPLAPELVNALSFLEDMGIRMDVFSGGQPPAGSRFARVGSVRHDNGMAADAVFYDATGRRLDWNNPDDVATFQEIVRRGREAGITGFGAGEGYMIPGSMHIGFGNEAIWGAGGRSENAAPWLVEAFNAATGQAANGQPVTASAQPQGGQPPMQQQQPTGLLGTMSTMSSPTQQDPGGWSIWDAITGRLPERAQGIAGRTIGNADWRDRMAIALAGMSMRPNEALIQTLQGRMDERADMRKVNATVEWLTSIGRTDLAEAVAAGGLMPDQGMGIALSPQPERQIRTDPNGVDRYVDTGEPVFPDVQPIAATGLSPDQLTQANALRDDLRTELQPFTLVQQGWSNINTFFNNPGGVSDQALVVAFAKVLDPGSVVREGEAAAISGAASIPRALQSQLLAALDGSGQLPDEVRLEIAQLGAKLYNEQAQRAQGRVQSYQTIAEQAGLPFDAINPFGAIELANVPEPQPAPGTPEAATGTTAPPAGAPAAAALPATPPPSLLQNESFKTMAERRNMTPEQFWQSLPESERQKLAGAFQ